jgi:hypothetical protein
VRKAHFDDRETDAAMFHGGPPLTFSDALIEVTAFASEGPAWLGNDLIQFGDFALNRSGHAAIVPSRHFVPKIDIARPLEMKEAAN